MDAGTATQPREFSFPQAALQVPGLCLLAYAFLASWTDLLRLSDWVMIYTVPLIAGVGIGLLVLASKRAFPREAFHGPDFFLVLFLAQIALLAILNPNLKTRNYLLAYAFVFGFQYLFLKPVAGRFVRLRTLLFVNALGVLTVAFFSFFVEFLGQVALGFDIQNHVPRTKEAKALFGGLPRAYGFSTEPTTLAFYFNTLGPLAIWEITQWKLRLGRPLKLALIAVILLGMGVTFSSGGFAILLISLGTSFLLGMWSLRLRGRTLILILALLAGAGALAVRFESTVGPVVEDLVGKLSLNKDYKSVAHRVEVFHRSIEDIRQAPLTGIGLGSLSARGLSSPINWYLSTAQESGLLSLFWIACFLAGSLALVLLGPPAMRLPFFVGMLSAILHLATVSTFFVPCALFIFALHGLYLKEARRASEALA